MLRHLLAALLVTGVLILSAAGAGCRRQDAGSVAVTQQAAKVPLPDRTVHVFCYHGVEPDTQNSYFSCSDDFKAQMSVLKDAGFQSISCQQLADYLDGDKDIPEKSVIITFDDGNRSVYETAVPILDKYGFTATMFVITNSIGGTGHMNWEQLAELHNKGYEIGSHTRGHVNLVKRGDMTAEEHHAKITSELRESKRVIEESLGFTIGAFAYPYGTYDETVMSATKDAGYRTAFSIDRGPAYAASNCFALPRQIVVRDNSLRTFKTWLAQEPLRLNNMSPALGKIMRKPDVELRAELGDSDVGADSLTVEGGRKPRVSPDHETGQIVIRTTLREGANNIRLQHQGNPSREKSWVVVYRP